MRVLTDFGGARIAGKEWLQPRLSRYASCYSVFSLIFGSSFWSFMNVQFLLFGWDIKGHKLFCWDWLFTCLPYFDFDSFICHWCFLKYMSVWIDHTLFMFKPYSLLFPLFLAHGLIFEVGLLMFIDRHLLLFPSSSFTSFLFVLYSFSHTVFEFLSLYLGVHWGNDGSVDMRDEVCSNPSMLGVFPVVLLLCLRESHYNLSNFLRIFMLMEDGVSKLLLKEKWVLALLKTQQNEVNLLKRIRWFGTA